MNSEAVFGAGTTSSSSSTSGSAVLDISGITFLSMYNSSYAFAELITNAFNAGYEIRSPARELVLQNNTSLANSEEIPNTLDPNYIDDVASQLSSIPIGYLVSIYLPEGTAVNNIPASDINYQSDENGYWNLISGYPFNTEIPTENYNEYNDSFNDPM